MFALPPDLRPGTGDHVSGVTCPTCHGSLRVRGEGNGHLHFTCRVGHAFSLQEALEAHEEFFEDTVWAAIRAAEELEQLLADGPGRMPRACADCSTEASRSSSPRSRRRTPEERADDSVPTSRSDRHRDGVIRPFLRRPPTAPRKTIGWPPSSSRR